MGERLWNASNLLSLFRIVLVIPIALLVLGNEPSQRYYAFGLIVLATLTDLFDGMLARKLHQITEFGKIIDPLADKIAVVVLVVILARQGKLPMWYLMAAVGRDLLLFLGGLYVKKVKGIILQSNQTGKWAVTAAALFIAMLVLDLSGFTVVVTTLMIVSTILLVVSLALYTKRFINVCSLHTNDQ